MMDYSCTVLIVAGNSIDRDQYRKSLLEDPSRSYQLLEATSVSEGLSLCRSNPIDVVLLDRLSSGKSEGGCLFLSSLRAEHNGTSPPVVMITGEETERVLTDPIGSGTEHYLRKDHLTSASLQETLQSAIEKVALLRQLKKIEADWIQTELERDRFFDLSLDLMAIAGVDGYYIRLNPVWESTFGFTHAELMNEPYLHWIHPDDRSATLEAGKALSQGDSVIGFENRHICRDGSYRWLSWNSSPYEGEKVVYAVARDITRQKQAELIRQENEETIRSQLAEIETIYSTTPIGLCSLDLDLRFVRVNEYLANIDCRSIEDHIGRTIREVVPGIADQIEPLYRQVLESRKPIVDVEVQGSTLDQPTIVRDYLVSYYPKMLPDGQVIGFNSMVQDITERKKVLATLEECNQELNQFAHVVSHDLKAPLRAVSNLSQWIEDDLQGLLTTDTQYQMTLLRRRVDRMAETIDGLLDYASIGQAKTFPEAFSVADVIQGAIDSLAPPPTFNIVISPMLPTLTAHRLRLFQVFANLIGNAIHHHDRSDGSIHISCKDCGDFYEFILADDGPGIAPEHHEKIFAIFQSINPQNNPHSTGIGLSIVKKIVETEGGTIRLESKLGQGATFSFTWPR